MYALLTTDYFSVNIGNRSTATDFKMTYTENGSEENGSIMETANLMKKSVFLSPTFIPTDLNIISGEIEIAKLETDHKEITVSPILQASNNVVSVLENNNRLDYHTLSLNNCTSTDVKVNNIDTECDYKNLVETSRITEKNDNIVLNQTQQTLQPTPFFSSSEVLNKKNLKFDGQDEKALISSISSDCSISNLVNPHNNDLNTVLETNEDQRKIGILSEEIVDSERLKTLLSSHKTVIKPAPVNTLINSSNSDKSNLIVDNITAESCVKNFSHTNFNNTIDMHSNEKNSRKYDFHNNNFTLSTTTQTKNYLQPVEVNILEPNVHNEELNTLPNDEIIKDKTTETIVSCRNKTPINNDINNHKNSKDPDKCMNETLSNDTRAVSKHSNFTCINEIKDLNKLDYKNGEENTIQHMVVDNGNNDFKLTVEEKIVNEVKIKDNVNDVILQNCIIADKVKESDTNVPVDKVSEIAIYLSSFYKINDKKSKNLKNNVLRESDTKLSIQGVEKPGGSQSGTKSNLQFQNIRTYHRHCKRNQSVEKTISKYALNSNKIMFGDSEKQITINICPVISKSSQFCNCSDFGQLSFYDGDKPYEHIHFLNHMNVNCNSDVIFGIYDDCNIYANINNLTEESFEETNSSDTIALDSNICLNTIAEQEEFLMDTNELMSQMEDEMNKVYSKPNIKFFYEVISGDYVDDNKKIYEKPIQEDVGFKRAFETSVFVQSIKIEETEEKNDVVSLVFNHF